jgi:hypothetical protein
MTHAVELIPIGLVYGVIFRGKPLYSERDPLRQVRKALPMWRSHTLYFVPSPLLGYGLVESLAILPASSLVMVVELEPDLAQLHTRWLSPTSIIESIDSLDPWVLESQLARHQDKALSKVERVVLNGGYLLHQQAYQQLETVLCQLVAQQVKNQALLAVMAPKWLTNIMSNVAFLPQHAGLLPRVSLPIVVAGAGLSLEEHRDTLYQNRSSFFLLAVDTALPALRAYGLTPDLVLALEGGFYNIYDFLGNSTQMPPIAVDMLAHRQTPRVCGAHCFFVTTHFASCQLLIRLQQTFSLSQLPAVGSVGPAAVALALQMTQHMVILCGLDFAYELGKTHARGSYTHSYQLAYWQRFSGIPLIDKTLERPLVQAVNREGDGLLSDTVLLTYAGALKQANSLRLRVLPSLTSVNLGIPVVEWSQLTSPKLSVLPPPSTIINHAQVRAFIEQELAFLAQGAIGDEQAWSLIDYVLLGLPYEVQQQREAHPLVQQRIDYYQKQWQYSLAELVKQEQ